MNTDQEWLPDAPSDTAPESPPPAPAPFDPYAGSRHMPWMDRSLSPSARAARRLRPELENFAVIEGREPNHADIDAMVGRISGDLIEVLRREWAADVLNERLEERAAERDGRPVDPSIGPRPLPLGGDPRDTTTGVFVARPEDIDWVFERFGRQRPDIVQANFGGRPVRPRFPGGSRFPRPQAAPPPIFRAPLPDQQPGGSLMTPVDPEMQPSSPPPFPADAPPAPPIPPTPARKPLLPEFEALIPPDLEEIFRPIPGTEAIAKGGEPLILPGPLIGDPGLQIPVHILSVLLGGKENDVRMVSGLVDPDELIKRYKYYGPLEELARKAGHIVGEGKGRVHGSRVHKALEELIKAETTARHLPEGMRAEISFVPGSVETPYGTRGSMRIDIIEEVDKNTMYVYELKTGGAALKEPRIDRTLRYFEGKTTVIVMELNPWRLPRK
jgi:hypothetical protein